MKMKRFKHVYGQNGRFVRLENRSSWSPVNDEKWHDPPRIKGEFIMHGEPFYALENDTLETIQSDNIRIFSEEARLLEQKRLEALALEELAKNIRAAQAEYDLEKLIEKIDFYLKQEDKY